VTTDSVRLGMDLGTSTTVAVVSGRGKRVKPLLFDGSPLMPSAVYADPEAGLLVGRDAVHAAVVAPERFEPHPKLRIDHGAVLLGDRSVPVVELIAAVLRRVLDEARRVVAADPDAVVLTCPAGWGPTRRALLTDAARTAGCGRVALVAEPVAASAYFVEAVRARIPAGAPIVVYDFGAGTFDASVIRRRGARFEVLATRGLDGTGGLDVDAAVVGYLATVYGTRDGERWQRLAQPRTPADRRAARRLWDHVRTGKESLSRLGSTVIHVPLFDEEVPLGREQLDELARQVIDRTVDTTRRVVDDAGVGPGTVGAVFLVGGASRMPAAATALHHALGVAPTVIEQPELVVAEGALSTSDTDQLETPAAPPAEHRGHPVVPIRARASVPPPTGAPPVHRTGDRPISRRRLAVLGVLLALLGFSAWAVINRPWTGADPDARPPAATESSQPIAGAPPPTASVSHADASPTVAKVADGASTDATTCTGVELSVIVVADPGSVRQGAHSRFTIKIRNISGRTCSRDISSDMQELYVQEGGTRQWSSDQCEFRTGNGLESFPPNHEVFFVLDWDGRVTAQGCDNRPPLAKGTYQLYGRVGTKVSNPTPLIVTA
jgi:actin-like ATPase involved in cell morphogenesis